MNPESLIEDPRAAPTLGGGGSCDLQAEAERLRVRLEEAEEILVAIRSGEVDAVVVKGPQGDQLFTLKGADEPYRVLIEEMNQGAVTLSATGAILYCNRRFAALVQRTMVEIIGASFQLLVCEAERPAFHAMLELGARSNGAGEFTLCTPHGGPVHAQLALSRLPDDAAAAVCLIATDISDSKRAEAELKSREARLAEAQHLARVGSWESDIRENRVTWSDELYRIHDLDREHFVPSNERDSNLIHPEDRGWVMERVSAAVRENGSFDHDHRILRADGTERVVQARGRIVLDEAGVPLKFVGTTQDITERKKVEAALEEANRQLLNVSRQAGMAEVATSVLHNVGNVLNSVNVSATLASGKISRSSIPDVARLAELFREQQADLPQFLAGARGAKLPAYLTHLAQHLAEEQRVVLAELSSLSAHIDHIKEIVAVQQSYARIAGVTETLAAESLVEDALRINAAALGRHGIEIVREYDEATPLLEVDKHKALQILVNLIGNAKQAMEGAEFPGKRLTLRIRPEGADFISISVLDDGVGIPPENLPRIFEHGFTTRKGGHGFGLHSSALAAKEMHGSLAAESSGKGRGATFTLVLPLCPPSSRL